MDKHTKALFFAILLGCSIIAVALSWTCRYQIAGGATFSGGGQLYIVRDSWTGRSWWEQVSKHR